MTLNVCSPSWDKADSYGRIAHELNDYLQAKGIYVNTIGQDSPNNVVRPVMGGIFMAYPTSYKTYSNMAYNGKRVAITMFESSVLPSGWVEELNQCAAVIVPSEWCKGIFLKNGVTTPLHVVPLGISSAYQYVKRPETTKTHNFLAIGLNNMRKGWDVAMTAFELAFWNHPDYKLTIKSRANAPKLNLNHPNITLIHEDYDDQQMQDLYASHDYFLFPTRGEGFGLPPREFALTGGITFATDWGGTADDITQWAIPIPVSKLAPAWESKAYEHLSNCGVWAEPDTAQLALLMRYAADNREKLLSEMPYVSQFCAEHYSWEKFSMRVYEIWENA